MPIAIQLPPREDQTAFNLRRWEEILADPELARLEQRIETDRHGHIIMTPPPGPPHGTRQFSIAKRLDCLLGGRVVTECPVTTSDGVKAADVGWFSEDRFGRAFDRRCFLEAPEICVEVLSPNNTDLEMAEKKALYFEAGAGEVWLCDEEGNMSFFTSPDGAATERSAHCPDFPVSIPL